MIHKENINGYNSLEQLSEDIGNLKYDALSEFLRLLSKKIEKDARADFERDRTNLSSELYQASEHIGEAWRISKPFMK